VEPPEVVRAVSWVNRFWPDMETVRAVAGEGEVHKRPQVQRYCLMGVKDSYTDFHVDFGGTSVWYHVLRVSGEWWGSLWLR
jgi:lysine-specific demethylase PHF8